MKKVIMLFLVFGITLNLTAQFLINLDTLNIEQLNLYKGKAVKIRNTGKILTIAGITTSVTSFGLLFGSLMIHGMTGPDVTPPTRMEFYATLCKCGIVTTIVGIPIWLTGGSRLKKAEIAIQKLNIVPENSMALGLGITINF